MDASHRQLREYQRKLGRRLGVDACGAHHHSLKLLARSEGLQSLCDAVHDCGGIHFEICNEAKNEAMGRRLAAAESVTQRS
jgi:hypothetical protein